LVYFRNFISGCADKILEAIGSAEKDRLEFAVYWNWLGATFHAERVNVLVFAINVTLENDRVNNFDDLVGAGIAMLELQR
jgi:hypothetical protein